MATTTFLLSHLFPLLLLLLLSRAFSSKPLEYQTLVLGSLSEPTSLHPHEDDDLSWTLDSTTLIDPDPFPFDTPPTSLRLRLHHRDSLLPTNSTPDLLFRLRLLRDSARVSTLDSIVAGAPKNATRPRLGDFNSSVVSGLAHGSGEYFTRIGIGTPLTYGYMVLDTGSDVVWIQCSPCQKCYSQTDPIFDPTKSRSFAAVPCFSPLCRRLDISGCDVHRRSCLYQVSYGDGSITNGEFSTETLTFHGGTRVGRIAFGCGHANEGLFVAAAGLLGLGRGKLSFPSQAGRRFGRQFSYCLVDRTSSISPKQQSSTVVFGDSAVPATGVVYTPMVTNPRLDTFYYVELTGISVGGAKVPGVSASDLRLDPSTGRGGVIVDSGTSVTRLTHPAYTALRDAFKAGAKGLRTAEGFSLFDTCFDLSGLTEVKVPTVVFHLGGGGGADLSLPAENYLIPVDTKGAFCFAFAGMDSGISIIGNIQQQGFRVVFDGAASRIGFAPRGC